MNLTDVQARREAAYDAGFDLGSSDGWEGNTYSDLAAGSMPEDQEFMEGYRHGYEDGLSAYRRTLES